MVGLGEEVLSLLLAEGQLGCRLCELLLEFLYAEGGQWGKEGYDKDDCDLVRLENSALRQENALLREECALLQRQA